MLHISQVLPLAENKQSHDFKFIAKGTKKTKRKGGYMVKMQDCKVLSSNHERQKMNIKSNINGEIRWIYFMLLIEIDGHEVFM